MFPFAKRQKFGVFSLLCFFRFFQQHGVSKPPWPFPRLDKKYESTTQKCKCLIFLWDVFLISYCLWEKSPTGIQRCKTYLFSGAKNHPNITGKGQNQCQKLLKFKKETYKILPHKMMILAKSWKLFFKQIYNNPKKNRENTN